VWDVPGRTLISVLQTNGSSGKIRFSPRGHLLAQLKRSSIGLYDLAARVPPVELELGDNGVRAFAFSRDGSLLVCVNSTKPGFQVVDVDRRAIIATNLPVGFDPDRSCGDVRLSPAGKRLYAEITRGLAGPRNELSVRVFGAQDEAFEHQFVVGHDELLWAMDLSPDGRFLATGSGYEQSNIRVWDALTFKLIAQLDTHTAWIPELSFSPDGHTLASASADETVRLWDTETWSERAVLRGHGAEVWSVAFTADGKLLASGAKDGEVLLWSTDELPASNDRFAFPDRVRSAAFLPGEPAILTVSANEQCSVWRLPALTETLLPFAPGSIQLFWPPNQIGAYDQTNFLRLYKVQHGGARLLGEYLIGPGATQIRYRSVRRDGRVRREVYWLNMAGEWQSFQVGEDLFVPEEFHDEKVSPDGKLEAVPSSSGIATIQNAETHERLVTLRGHLLAVDGVAFAPDGKRLATTSGGKEAAKIWDTATWQELLNLEGEGMNLYQAEFSEDGNVLLVGWRHNGFWQLWRAPSWHEIEDIERNGGGWPRNEE